MLDKTIRSLAIEAANRNGLDPSLVLAIVTVESSGVVSAERFEPEFRWFVSLSGAPIARSGMSTKEIQRIAFAELGAEEYGLQSRSLGLMQIMGAAARELGYTGDLALLKQDPALALEWGCRKLAACRRRWPHLWDFVAAYNAGSPRHLADGTYENKHYVDKVRDALVSI